MRKKHHLSELLIKYIDIRNCHSVTELVLNLLTEKLWIIHGKSLIRKVLLNCSYCKRQRILPTPTLNDSPAKKVSVPTSPFMHSVIIISGPCLLGFQEKTDQMKQLLNVAELYLRV